MLHSSISLKNQWYRIPGVSEQVLELHRGQGMDIYWRDTYQCPTEEEYKQMVINSKLVEYTVVPAF